MLGRNHKYSTLLMDADETLFDFGKCEYKALSNTLKSAGLIFSDEVYQSFTAINSRLWREYEKNNITRSELRVRRFRELIEKCFDGFNKADELADIYIEMLSQQGILIDGTEDALKALTEHYDIYVITNGLKAVQRGRFARTDITAYIKKIFISDEMNVQKPMKEFFDIVLSEIDERDKSKILVVGDSLTSDMQGGRNAGLDTCLFDPKDKVEMPDPLCDHKIHKLIELIDF